MKYIELINSIIKKKAIETDNIVLYGENIDAGSCISGLTRGLKVKEGNLVINTPNSENAQTGLGFGLMLNGVNSIFFLKQHDFIILGIDHMVNTYNFVRLKRPKASYTIFFVIVDNGYQGLQSSLNNFSDLCSIARIPGFTITNKADIEAILKEHLVKPGFRIIGISQRLFKEELEDIESIGSNDDKTMFKYKKGDDATIVCFNLSFSYGKELQKRMEENSISASLYTVNSGTPIDWKDIHEDAAKTGRIIVIDDSKSENLPCYSLLAGLPEECRSKMIIKREINKDDNSWLAPNEDMLEIDYDRIIKGCRR